MKIIDRVFSRFLIVATLLATVVSCSEDTMDAINKDNNHSLDTPAKFILADVITSTAFYCVGGDINTYTSVYVEHEAGVHNQLWRAENRQAEPSAASTFNNTWGNLYITLNNAKLIVEKCSVGGSQEGNDVTKGMGEVLLAYNLALLTDMFGNVPWSQACDIDNYMTPELDSQQSIYEQISTYLDNAISDLQGSDSQAPGAYDLLYNGDASKWLKLAYGLKARYAMRLIHKSSSANADLQSVIDNVDLSFSSASEQAAFDHYDASNLNPLFDFEWSRDGIAASKSLYDKLNARSDPRIRRCYFDSNTWDHYSVPTNLVPNGASEELQYYYNYSVFVFAQIAPTYLLSYHELLFLKAEAMCRLNHSTEAADVLKEAVVAAMANTEVSVAAAMNAPTINNYGGLVDITGDEISQTEAESYFDNTIKPLFDAHPLQETMVQKYLAFWGANGESTECFNDIRRLKAMGENYITLANQYNTSKFPLRCPYGNDDTTTNPNVQEAYGNGQYVYSEPVWWAGGTR